MRGLLKYLRENWQPACLICGALISAVGAVALVYSLSTWLLPKLGIWPAVVMAGVLLSAGALQAARMTVVEE
jgi:hypothetical protein